MINSVKTAPRFLFTALFALCLIVPGAATADEKTSVSSDEQRQQYDTERTILNMVASNVKLQWSSHEEKNVVPITIRLKNNDSFTLSVTDVSGQTTTFLIVPEKPTP